MVTQANVDAGQILNTAQVVSTQVPTPVEDTETTPIAQTPALTIAKTAGTPTDVNGNGLTDAAAGAGDNDNVVCTVIHDLISLLSNAKNKRQGGVNE